jgi:hypothetical protein
MSRRPEKQQRGPVKIIMGSSCRRVTSTEGKIKFQTLNLAIVPHASGPYFPGESNLSITTTSSTQAFYPFIYFQVVNNILEGESRQSF